MRRPAAGCWNPLLGPEVPAARGGGACTGGAGLRLSPSTRAGGRISGKRNLARTRRRTRDLRSHWAPGGCSPGGTGRPPSPPPQGLQVSSVNTAPDAPHSPSGHCRYPPADSGSETKNFLVRLLTYLPGKPIAEIPISPQLLYNIGKLAAKLDKTLEKFQHPRLSSLRRESFIWNLKNVPLLEKYIHALGQNRNRKIVEQVIQLFREEVETKLSDFRECINHGDLNDHNILVEPSTSASEDAAYQVSGILDFDDMSYGYYVFEVAITIMYMMIESQDPISVGGHVLAGFESIIPLTAVERGALYLLVCSRFCQSLVIAAYSCQLHPENQEYIMITAKTGWKHLQQMFDMGQKAVEKIWFETAKSYESKIAM